MNIKSIVKDKQREINEYQQMIDEARSEIAEINMSLLALMNGDGGKEMIRHVYWQTEVTVAQIGDVIGCKANRVASFVGLLHSGYNCSECGTGTYFSSRSARAKGEVTLCECQELARKQKHVESIARWERHDVERQDVLRQLKEMPYRQYLETDHWQEVRKGAHRRAGYRCQMCGESHITLDVHHNTYDNRGEERNRDVIVLCRDCHSKHHIGG